MNTLERLTKILIDQYKVDPAKLTLHAPLAELGIDSLGMVELLFIVEDEFGVKLPPDTESLSTLDEAVRRIDGLISAQHGTGASLPRQPA